MPLELLSRSGSATWQATIERERSARLQLRNACRPLPTLSHLDEPPPREPSLSCARPQTEGSRVRLPLSASMACMGLTHGEVTMWAGKSLQQNPQMAAHVFSPKWDMLPRGATTTLTSFANLRSEPAELVKTSPKVKRQFSLPNHMVSYPETGQWLL
ncbi:unnamed protein product [Durusdinium trenchii]|uniref:Uncharacterized protein n=1 Tax=Durusdinium trenchii TaxID=1381693 RepID=A0ABP0PWU3_9DINO